MENSLGDYLIGLNYEKETTRKVLPKSNRPSEAVSTASCSLCAQPSAQAGGGPRGLESQPASAARSTEAGGVSPAVSGGT